MSSSVPDLPELDPRIDPGLRDKIARQRAKVNASLTGVDPEVHQRHVEALNKGLGISAPLLPPGPTPPALPLPVWDDVTTTTDQLVDDFLAKIL